MQAADTGSADIVSLLLAAGADIEARDIVSKRISICLAHVCICVCLFVCVLYSSIIVYDKWKVSFYSILIFHDCDMEDMMIWLVWVMFLVIVLIIVICLLVLLLACMKMNVFDESLFWISHQCFVYFCVFLCFCIL